MLPATVLEYLSVPSSCFVGCLQHPEIFVLSGQTLFWNKPEVIQSKIRGKGWVFNFSNRFLGQKILEGERLVSWIIVMVEDPNTEPKFRPSSAHSFVMYPLQRFNIISSVD
jgi:hypothetical protein